MGLGIYSTKPNYDIKLYKNLYSESILDNKPFFNIGAGNFYHPYMHISWWNPEKMKEFLKVAGFDEIYYSAYNQSSNPILRNEKMFDFKCTHMSMYMEAIK